MKMNEKLLTLRKANGLTQMKLAEMMNVSRQAISRWEVGEAVPSTENLKFLGRLYGVSLEYLLHEDAPEPVPQESDKITAKSDADKRPKRWKLIAILMAMIVSIIVFLCVLLLREPQSPMPLDELERSEIEIDNMDHFELDF